MKKKKSFIGKLFSAIGIILLTLLVLLVGAVGYLIISMNNASLSVDDVDAYVEAEPMAPEERLSFDESGNVTMKLDKSDVYWYYRNEKGEDFDEQFRDIAESAGLGFKGCGLTLVPGGVFVDVDMSFFSIPIRFSLPSSLRYTDKEIVLHPEAVKLGKIVLPLTLLEELVDEIDFLDERIDFDEDDMDIRLSYKPAFLNGIDSLEPGLDCLVLKGRMNADFLEKCDRGYNTYNLAYYRFLCKGYGMAENIVESRIESREAAEKVFFGYLSEDPGLLDDVLYELLCFMDQSEASEYVPNLENHQFACRIADVFSRMEEVEKHRILQADYNENKKNWDILINKMADDYNRSRFKAKEGELLYNGQPFDVVEYMANDWLLYECLIDPEDYTYALVDYDGARDPKNPALKKIFTDTAEIPEGLNPDAGYPLALIIKGMDGGYWAGFRTHVTRVTHADSNADDYLQLYKLSEEMTETIMNSETVPVWRYE